MNEFVSAVTQKHIGSTIEALRKNRFDAEYVESPAGLIARLEKMIPAGSSCSIGGSVTLAQTGVRQWLEERRDITYLDRYAKDADEVQVMREALTCDVYLTSTNALTKAGQLYNVDGRANRVASICFGPKKVIVVAGYNKIVEDLDAARTRLKNFAEPPNALRLKKKVPCAETGTCGNCMSDDRMCSQELITGWQAFPGRITVFIMGGEYGF